MISSGSSQLQETVTDRQPDTESQGSIGNFLIGPLPLSSGQHRVPAGAPNWPAALAQRGLDVSLKAYQFMCSERFPVMFPHWPESHKVAALLAPLRPITTTTTYTHCSPSIKVFSRLKVCRGQSKGLGHLGRVPI